MSEPRVSVIVPTYRRPELLVRCLAGIYGQVRPADEVIVVVRRTDVETLDALTQSQSVLGGVPTIVGVHEPGVVAALAAGFERATGDVIVLTDDDAVARPGWLATLLAHYADARVACVGGRDVQDETDPEPTR